MDNQKKNPFQKIETQEELPEKMKDKVLGSIGFGQLIRDFTELFTAKAGETAIELFKGDVLPKKKGETSDQAENDESKG